MNNEIISYIKAAKEHGLPDSEIKHNLLNAGWEGPEIEDNFAHYAVDSQKGKNESASVLTKMMSGPEQDQNPHLNGVAENRLEALNSQPGTKKSRLILWTAVILIILLLGAGGYYAYANGYIGSSNAWEKFIQKPQEKVYRNEFKISYQDMGEIDSKKAAGSLFSFAKIRLAFDGNFYVNSANEKSPESTSEVTYTLASGSSSISTGFKYKLIDRNLYVDLGDNPLLRAISSELNRNLPDGQKVSWLKINFDEINKLISENGQATQGQLDDYKTFKEIFNPSLKGELEKIWSDSKFIKVRKNLGREKLGSVNTIHYENELDKEALKQMLQKYLDKLREVFGKAYAEEDLNNSPGWDYTKELIFALIDKLEIKQMETWIGATDSNLYKVKFVSTAPSIASIVNNSEKIGELFPSNQDYNRIYHVKNMQRALTEYKTDYGGYPEAADGHPVGLVPNYLYQENKAPAAEGNCTDYYNTYWYKPTGTKSTINNRVVYSSYEFTFCLGADYKDYEYQLPSYSSTTVTRKAGIGMLTPDGIKTGIPCPGDQTQCGSNLSEDAKKEKRKNLMREVVSNIDFAGEINLESNYKDYNKLVKIEIPNDALDVVTILNNAIEKSRDAKRLADVRQLASALELYFNDKSSYPKELKDMTPTYIGIIPTAPLPPDGNCSLGDNTYNYKLISSSSYTLDFCLGAQTGGYEAGRHVLSPTGIN